ncbi:MAG: PIN domain-containing protein [Spirochaetes bacterium]|uniref:PIN domain-containing protein n=1 Tax=Candidatus Aphodenecus pullistercoris TaxID=2840669 RepID=A0A9D9HAD2_9SPIR|nr:PIN domain-containing protein [Candidatus Aphodenecus pullistercoris]
MTVLFDTNIILDSMLERATFAKASSDSVQMALEQGFRCLFCASSATDLFYIIRRQTGNRKSAWEKLTLLSYVFEIASVTGEDIMAALAGTMSDFEDAVVSAVAGRYHASYIVTRNVKDFRFSGVPAIIPQEFIRLVSIQSNDDDGLP